MNRRSLGCLVVVFAIWSVSAFCESYSANQKLLQEIWSARWITAQESVDDAYGVYLFRKKIFLEDGGGQEFIVHVSADSRYKLFVNGILVSLGPSPGDLYNWNYDTVDIADFLVSGENVIAAVVWNEGDDRPEYQISKGTGFLLQGDGEREEIVNTDASWKAVESDAFSPVTGIGHAGYYVAGPGERRDYRKFRNGFRKLEYDDEDWEFAQLLATGWPPGPKPKAVSHEAGWMLVPRKIPPLELTPQSFQAIRRISGAESREEGFSFQVSKNTTAKVLLDQGSLTNAFPRFVFSGGKDAEIEIIYAESLFTEIPQLQSPYKGNRNEIEGKQIAGRKDVVISDGGEFRVFETLSWRTFRYVELTIATEGEPLRIDEISSTFVGYPFELNSEFRSSDESLERILDIGWRTARLCAVELYMDCPYYERLQYIGDTRIQALVTLYNSGDDRLIKNALNLMDQSRISEGLTLSRHPSQTPQLITGFSLFYIGMLHDYWKYGEDTDFVAGKLEGMRAILSFFQKYRGDDGLLHDLPYWLFVDWVDGEEGWLHGVPPHGPKGETSLFDLQLLWAYQQAAEMENHLGSPEKSEELRRNIYVLKESIRRNYWDAGRGVLKDNAGGKASVSQQANSLAILTGVVVGDEARRLAEKLESGEGMTPASIYFRYYLHLAMSKAGIGDRYLHWLEKWRENIEFGLTTWAEKSEVETSRSDCHAWGSSPNIELFRIVLGIDSAAPSWKEVTISPHLGNLERVEGSIPHPKGIISVSYQKTGEKLKAQIELPNETTGTFNWNGRQYALDPGSNVFEL